MDALTPQASLVQQTYDALLDAICTGQFPPGARLAQDQLAAELGVSRQPVNSALAMLKAQRFVEETGRRGVVVAPLEADFFRAIYEFRSGVDPVAVARATENLTDDGIARARAAITQGERAIQTGLPQDAIRADMAFHDLTYALSGNQLIRDAMQLNWRHLQRGMAVVLANPGMTEAVWVEHREILDHMIAGDAERAAEAARTHVIEAAKRIVSQQ